MARVEAGSVDERLEPDPDSFFTSRRILTSSAEVMKKKTGGPNVIATEASEGTTTGNQMKVEHACGKVCSVFPLKHCLQESENYYNNNARSSQTPIK